MADDLDTTDPAAELQAELADAIGVTETDDVVIEGAPNANDPVVESEVKPEAKPEAKPENELYAPLPETNPRKTHERFAKLIEGHRDLEGKVKELETQVGRVKELEAANQQHEQGWKVFQEMGFASDEAVADLVQFSQYRNALSSGNFDAAAQLLQEQARQLSLLSGRRIDVNPLAGFQDLDQRFKAGELDEPTALELARNRHVQTLQADHQRRQQQQNDQYTQQTQEIRGGALQVDSVVSDLMRDPDYAKVEPELLKQLDHIKTNYPPSMWAREVKRTYENEARVLRAATAIRQPTPLRGSGHSGGLPAPKTMQDAVLQQLGLS